MSQFTLPLFFTLFALAIVWLVLVNVLFVRLAKNHPSMYSEIGSPRGFERKATPSLFRFLLSRRPESLGDASIVGIFTTKSKGHLGAWSGSICGATKIRTSQSE